MVFRMFAAAIAAGALAAVLITGLQSIITLPLILEAETYEFSAPAHDHGGEGEAAQEGHEHGPTNAAGEAEWMPEDGLERTLYTLLANTGAGIGFSLLIVVGLSFDLASVNATRGVLWGVAGFAVFTLSPALGLPPGAPGMLTPDEQAAQIWWVITVLCSGAGLAALVFGKNIVVKAIGPLLLAAPHIWGAPPLLFGESPLPPNMAARFAAASIVLSAVFWVVIGYFSGAYFARFGEKEPGA